MDQAILDCLDVALADHHRPARVDTDSLSGSWKALVAQFGGRAEIVVRRINAHLLPEQRCEAHIAFCEGPSYGAFAMLHRYSFIVLNVGLVPTLADFFERMMATKGLWPRVGDQACLHPSEHISAAETFPAHTLWNVLPARSPDDPLRRAMAVVFMSECFDLIVRHEFAHLALGHLARDACRAVNGDPLAVQALELAADGHAAIWGLEPLKDLPRKFGKYPSDIGEAYRAFHSTPDDAMINYLLAIFFVLRLMDETDWNNRTLTHRGHPPAPMRFHATCIHLIEHFKQNGNAAAEAQILRTMQDIWELGELIFATTLSRTPKHSIKELTLSEKSEQHYNLVSDRARTLPEHLFGLSRK